MLQKQKKEITEYVNVCKISKKDWRKFFEKLYAKKQTSSPLQRDPETVNSDQVQISQEEVMEAVKRLKNRKSPGPDGIHNELLKYKGETLQQILHILFNKILEEKTVPTE